MKKIFILIILCVLAGIVLFTAPFFGVKTITLNSLFNSFTTNYVFWQIRMPRVITSFLAGMVLSLGGMTFQAMFRNPLATPFTLGVSSGAAFGASAYILLGFSISVLGISGITFFAFLGSLVSIFIVYGITKIKRGFSTSTMLLAGVAISFFFSSLILFIQYMSDFTQTFSIVRWLMGGFEIVGFGSFFSMLPFATAGLIIIFFQINELNLISTGDDIAVSRGVNINKSKTLLFFATSLMISGVVSICGPIGFVGMMCPHICRLMIGNNHKYLMPASVIFGGMFLTACDAVSRIVIAPAEIPVGIITALLGGPFFLWLLLGGSSERSMLKG
jgi:iron complex transport system permease protein